MIDFDWGGGLNDFVLMYNVDVVSKIYGFDLIMGYINCSGFGFC